MTAPGRTKVLIVDDSAVVRQVLSAVLDRDPGIQVTGAAADPIFAMDRMNKEWPDVVVLDIEMPRMDGITFLKKLMAVRPTPVVICSTLTERGAAITMTALSAGAVGIVTKPKAGLKSFLEDEATELIHAVKAAAAGDMRRVKAASVALTSRSGKPSVRQGASSRMTPARGSVLTVDTARLVAVGTSTGGTQALELVLTSLPRVGAGIVIVQHMPEHFTTAFAARLDGLCQSDVAEATDGERVLPGRVLIAPGGRHLAIERDGAHYRARVSEGPRVNRHKPSVDVLFRSVASCAGANGLGVIMTGMGDDGARGLLQMHEAGAQTIGQDENTCVVYGMPRVAHELGAVDQEVALTSIAGLIQRFAGA
jgi:two-component system, chemotaxis family, protein-glutamate methylesterase/glutaminase